MQARDRRALVEDGRRDDQRQRRERERGEVGVEREHDHRGQQDRADHLRQGGEARAEKRPDLSHVDRRARDQLADGLALENAQIERMQVSEEAVSQVVLHPEPDATRDALAGPGDTATTIATTASASAERTSPLRSPSEILFTASPTSSGTRTTPMIAPRERRTATRSPRR